MLSSISALFAQQEARLLRFPAIHGNQIVFSYAGDLYTVAATGGVARKLTNNVGYEMFARFSPDGKWIAFTGQYDGNTEVYLMSADGGIPKRLTFTATLDRDDVSDRMGPNNIVMAWKDNAHIVYRSRRIEPIDFKSQLFVVSVEGGVPEQLPLPRGGFCSFSPDGKRMAYNRVFREFRMWKRYRGGGRRITFGCTTSTPSKRPILPTILLKTSFPCGTPTKSISRLIAMKTKG